MAKRDHRPRMDTTICPNPDECAEVFHVELAEGDVCECCGTEVAGDEDPTGLWTAIDEYDREVYGI